MLPTLDDLYRSFRLADVFDILVVACLLYAGIQWIRQTTSRRVFLGLALLAVVYMTARLLSMYLTIMLFNVGLTVLLIALVIIFQEISRRAFQRLAAVGPWTPAGGTSLAVSELTALAEVLFDLARAVSGALVVLPRTEPLDRHVTGGHTLEGSSSATLLQSIFDPHSPGHDGAVLIEHGRVTRFGTQLPLTTRRLAGLGTRHSTAVGLASAAMPGAGRSRTRRREHCRRRQTRDGAQHKRLGGQAGTAAGRPLPGRGPPKLGPTVDCGFDAQVAGPVAGDRSLVRGGVPRRDSAAHVRGPH